MDSREGDGGPALTQIGGTGSGPTQLPTGTGCPGVWVLLSFLICHLPTVKVRCGSATACLREALYHSKHRTGLSYIKTLSLNVVVKALRR